MVNHQQPKLNNQTGPLMELTNEEAMEQIAAESDNLVMVVKLPHQHMEQLDLAQDQDQEPMDLLDKLDQAQVLMVHQEFQVNLAQADTVDNMDQAHMVNKEQEALVHMVNKEQEILAHMAAPEEHMEQEVELIEHLDQEPIDQQLALEVKLDNQDQPNNQEHQEHLEHLEQLERLEADTHLHMALVTNLHIDMEETKDDL